MRDWGFGLMVRNLMIARGDGRELELGVKWMEGKVPGYIMSFLNCTYITPHSLR
jgi:hypothetical protein